MPLQCDLGIHDWKKVYLKTNSCNVQERCSRCGIVKGQVVEIHEKRKKGYISSGSCNVQEVCLRCGTVKGQVVEIHEMWKRDYISSNSCKVQERCLRCGALRGQVSELHEWEFIEKKGLCLKEQVCKRCGEVEQVTESHEWEWVEKSPCLKEQVCKRCGTTGQVDQKEHRWKEVYNPGSDYIQETCENCGVSRSRVSAFSAFLGQEAVKRSLITLVVATRQKEEALHHLLLCGQTGMGKVTLAKIITDEMGVNSKIVAGKTINQAEDLAKILTNLRAGDILVIEQVESLRDQILETLISAMEDFSIDVVVGKGPSTRSIKLKLPRFTVIGTTSKPSQVDDQLERLMFAFTFDPYEREDIGRLILLDAKQKGIIIDKEATNLLAEQSNGCPADALGILKKVYDYAISFSDGQITPKIARDAFTIFISKNSPQPFDRQPIPDDVRMFVWNRDGGHCVVCGSQENLEFDHIIPVSKGGSNTARNIQLLCEKHNRSKGANIV